MLIKPATYSRTKFIFESSSLKIYCEVSSVLHLIYHSFDKLCKKLITSDGGVDVTGAPVYILVEGANIRTRGYATHQRGLGAPFF